MIRKNKNGNTAVVARWVGALVCVLALIPSSMAQSLSPLSKQHAEALKSLYCGVCVELGNVVHIKQASFTDDYVHPPSIILEAATEGHLTDRIGIAEGARAKVDHVCVGGSHRVEGLVVLPIPEAQRNNKWVQLQAHPDRIDGVCLGSLQPVEVFFESVMSDVFARRLKEFDARLNPEKIEQLVRNRLADALAKDRALLKEAIKREVVAELKGQREGVTNDRFDSTSSALICTSGAYSCDGRSPEQCCRCADHPGVDGTCDAHASPRSWLPKPSNR